MTIIFFISNLTSYVENIYAILLIQSDICKNSKVVRFISKRYVIILDGSIGEIKVLNLTLQKRKKNRKINDFSVFERNKNGGKCAKYPESAIDNVLRQFSIILSPVLFLRAVSKRIFLVRMARLSPSRNTVSLIFALSIHTRRPLCVAHNKGWGEKKGGQIRDYRL